MRRPRINAPLPGPKAAKWIEQDAKYISPSYTRVYPLAAARGSGAWIEDPDGNQFLDFTAGIAVAATGHCHPEVTAAIRDQAGKLIHMSGTDFYYSPQIRLAEKLAGLLPGPAARKVFFANSGTEAVEAAFKLARWKTGRPLTVAFFGAFHGRTMGALSLTGSKTGQRQGYQPLVPGVHHVPYAYCYRCPYNLTHPDCNLACVDYIDQTLFKTVLPPEECAAIVVEPIQGEGGYVVPPPEFHVRLKTLAEKYGILYIADEVQSGMGRTGKMFACQHFEVEPDILAMAKGIASGMPLGVMAAKAEIMTWPPGSHGSTFGGNPISCAAALTTIDLLERGLMVNAAERGAQLLAGLRELASEFESIGDVRGIGLMVGLELVRDRETKERAGELVKRIIDQCFRKGLLLLPCGQNTIRFCPPLTISEDELDVGLSILREVMKKEGC